MKKFIELEVSGDKKVFNTDFIYKIEKVDEAKSRIFLNTIEVGGHQLQEEVVQLSYSNLMKLLNVSTFADVDINGMIEKMFKKDTEAS